MYVCVWLCVVSGISNTHQEFYVMLSRNTLEDRLMTNLQAGLKIVILYTSRWPFGSSIEDTVQEKQFNLKAQYTRIISGLVKNGNMKSSKYNSE